MSAVSPIRAARRPALIAALAVFAAVTVATSAYFPAAQGRGGAVASSDVAATDVGLDILLRGGNAADAAVATALALAVVFPEAGNLGGGGFAVVRMAGELATLDFRETAPAEARRDMYLDADGEPRGRASLDGPLAAGVPGSPTGLFELHRRFGRLPWPTVVEPAIELAANGFRVSRRTHASIRDRRDRLSAFPETARVWLPGSMPPPAGSTMKLPRLAATLRGYADRGPEAITRGPVARAVGEASRRHGGILKAADLVAYRPIWRAPVRFTAFDWQAASMDLPSSGGILLGQILGTAERLSWSEIPPFGAERAHLLAEIWRRAFADRYLLGDPESTAAESAQLLDPRWLDVRARQIRRNEATPSREVSPWSRMPAAESPDTTHLSVVDAEGGAVALTTTLNSLFGCGLLVSEAGFFLNNEMGDFATAPGHPNDYGLIQGVANEIAPGRRMLSSMSPIIVWRDADVIVLGGRGGARIPTAVAQVLLNVLVDGDSLQTAINRPRLHHQWLPDQLLAESDAIGPETRQALRRHGHQVVTADRSASVTAVRQHPSGKVEAAADPREPGSASVLHPDF